MTGFTCYDFMVRVSIHPSAFRHGVGAEAIEVAWRSGESRECWLDDKEPRRLLRIGADAEGQDLELVALVFDQDRALITHAMRARKVAYNLVRRSRRRS